MRELRTVFALLLNALRVVIWSVGTVWLGGKTIARSAVLLFRWRWIMAQVLVCPRGHEVPVYGLWDCACGSRTGCHTASSRLRFVRFTINRTISQAAASITP